MKRLIQNSMFLFVFLFSIAVSAYAQVPPWLADLNEEIDMMEENVASCRADIADFQAEIDALIKNTPPPITGTPTETRIRELQKKRALWSCWADQADKKIRRLKVIRDLLKDKYGASSPSIQHEIDKSRDKANGAERKVKEMKQAGEKLGDTINGALNERK